MNNLSKKSKVKDKNAAKDDKGSEASLSQKNKSYSSENNYTVQSIEENNYVAQSIEKENNTDEKVDFRVNSDNIAQAFVYSEILGTPLCKRRRGW